VSCLERCPSSRRCLPWSSWSGSGYEDSRTRALTCSMLMQQNARTTAAALLPPLTHLPPTMVLPGKEVVDKVVNGQGLGEKVQNNKTGEE